jgi:hypothetical protein
MFEENATFEKSFVSKARKYPSIMVRYVSLSNCGGVVIRKAFRLGNQH